jgi:hypothetical protein
MFCLQVEILMFKTLEGHPAVMKLPWKLHGRWETSCTSNHTLCLYHGAIRQNSPSIPSSSILHTIPSS